MHHRTSAGTAANPLWLDQAPSTRWGIGVTALLLVGVGPAVLLAVAPVNVLVAALGGGSALLAGITLAVRALFVRVYADGEAILIRSLLRSRRIPLRDVVGVELNAIYWCARRGRLRRTRPAPLSGGGGRQGLGPGRQELDASLERRRLEAWAEQAVGARIKHRARLVGTLDDDALARESQVAAAGVRWESRRRFLAPPPARWGVVRDAVLKEQTDRAGGGAPKTTRTPSAPAPSGG